MSLFCEIDEETCAAILKDLQKYKRAGYQGSTAELVLKLDENGHARARYNGGVFPRAQVKRKKYEWGLRHEGPRTTMKNNVASTAQLAKYAAYIKPLK